MLLKVTIPTRRFRPQPGATIAMLLGVLALVSLGVWQLHRKAWKEEIIATVEARRMAPPIALDVALKRRSAGEDIRYLPVFVSGVYDHDAERHVFGTLNGAPGYYVFTPIQPLADDEPIYINRGFAPTKLKQLESRLDGAPEGGVQVVGLFREAEQKQGLAALFAPIDQPTDNIYYVRDPSRFSSTERAWYVDSRGGENAAQWPKGDTTKITFSNRHLEYALTWFGLAVTLIGVWFAFSRRSEA